MKSSWKGKANNESCYYLILRKIKASDKILKSKSVYSKKRYELFKL